MGKVETKITYDEFIELAKECGITINQANIAVVHIPNRTNDYAELFTIDGAKITIWLEPEKRLAYITSLTSKEKASYY